MGIGSLRDGHKRWFAKLMEIRTFIDVLEKDSYRQLKRAGPRQFDTVYGKHISVAITSWGKQAASSKQASKQARLVEPKSTWCFLGWGRCASGRWRALSRPFVVPAIPTSIITQGMTVGLVWGLKGGLALGQRPLIYLAYEVLSRRLARAKNTVYRVFGNYRTIL